MNIIITNPWRNEEQSLAAIRASLPRHSWWTLFSSAQVHGRELLSDKPMHAASETYRQYQQPGVSSFRQTLSASASSYTRDLQRLSGLVSVGWRSSQQFNCDTTRSHGIIIFFYVRCFSDSHWLSRWAFLVTTSSNYYSSGLSQNLSGKLIDRHKSIKKLATVALTSSLLRLEDGCRVTVCLLFSVEYSPLVLFVFTFAVCAKYPSHIARRMFSGSCSELVNSI